MRRYTLPERYGLREEQGRGADKKGILDARMPYSYMYNSERPAQNLETGFVSLAHHHVSDIDNLGVAGPLVLVLADPKNLASVRLLASLQGQQAHAMNVNGFPGMRKIC